VPLRALHTPPPFPCFETEDDHLREAETGESARAVNSAHDFARGKKSRDCRLRLRVHLDPAHTEVRAEQQFDLSLSGVDAE